MILSRRRALFGLLAAPAIVAAPSLMRVSTLPGDLLSVQWYADGANASMQGYAGFEELVTATLRKRAPQIAANVQANNALWAYLARRWA